MSGQEFLSSKVEKKRKEERLSKYLRGLGEMRLQTDAENKKDRMGIAESIIQEE